MLKTYTYLEKINFSNLYSSELENEIFEKLKNISNDLTKALSDDFKILSNENTSVKELKIEFDNPYYRQSATGIIQEVNFENNTDFKIYVEVLIDFQKVLISSKGDPQSETMRILNEKIKSKYNLEGKSEFREI